MRMSFDVAANAYARYIGRYSTPLAPRFIELAEVASGSALDVGCGPGALTRELAARLGASSVAAVDLSEPFVAACRASVPGADVRLASAEALPFEDDTFDAALAQLVLSFIRDADRAAAELVRVVRPGGTVATCMFEANGFTLVRIFWEAALALDPEAPNDARLPFRRMPELVSLFERAGLEDIATDVIDIEAEYADFDDYWAPFSFGIGPAGIYLAAQSVERRAALRDACFEALGGPTAPFTLDAKVLAIRGRAPARSR